MTPARILRRHLSGCALLIGGVIAAVLTSLVDETFNGVSLLGILAVMYGGHLILDSIDRSSRLALSADSSDTEGTTP